MEIVDCQVNYGKSLFGPNCKIEIYSKAAKKMGITRALIIPTLTHEIKIDSLVEKSCIWEETEKGLLYKKEIIEKKTGKVITRKNPKNPYQNMNNFVLNKIRELNKNLDIKYYFIPKIHPLLDTEKELERLIEEPETVALKIHGLATHTTPNQVPGWIVKLANSYSKPLFVHTDYLNKNFKDNRTPESLKKIIYKNTPKDWLTWAELTKPHKLYLAHLVRMDMESIDKINKSKNIVVGTGPDIMLEQEPWRLKQQPTENILYKALISINSKKLVFSTDFAWNVFKRGNWTQFDWGSIERIVEQAKKIGLPKEELSDILSNNAIEFFSLD